MLSQIGFGRRLLSRDSASASSRGHASYRSPDDLRAHFTVHTSTHVFVRTSLHTSTHVFVSTSLHTSTHVFVRTSLYTSTHVFVRTSLHTSTQVFVRTSLHIYQLTLSSHLCTWLQLIYTLYLYTCPQTHLFYTSTLQKIKIHFFKFQPLQLLLITA